jgi:hypothetical protein
LVPIPTFPLSFSVRTFDVRAELPRKLNFQPLPSPHEVTVLSGLAVPLFIVEIAAAAATEGSKSDVIPDNAPAGVSTAVEWALTVPELVPDVINELQVT